MKDRVSGKTDHTWVPHPGPRRVLFLDFDGVLNNKSTRNRYSWHTGLDPNNVARLNELMERAPGLEIIISSSWRIGYSIKELREAMSLGGFRHCPQVLDKTGNSGSTRGEQIQRWLDGLEWRNDRPIDVWARKRPVARFAIVDDMDHDMAHLAHMLVKTDGQTGMVGADVDRILAMLEMDPSLKRAEEEEKKGAV